MLVSSETVVRLFYVVVAVVVLVAAVVVNVCFQFLRNFLKLTKKLQACLNFYNDVNFDIAMVHP